MVYIVGLIVYEYYAGNYTPGPIKPKPAHFSVVFSVVPTIVFGYQCHFSVNPIYSSMKHRTLKCFALAATMAMAICVVLYTLAAVYGYLTFGSLVNEDILMSYEGGGFVYAGMYIMVLKVITVSMQNTFSTIKILRL